VHFGTSPTGKAVAEALEYLRVREVAGAKGAPDPPLEIVTRAWQRHVAPNGTVDLKAYTFCVLERLRQALRRRDVFVMPSIRYADPRSGLLAGEAWAAARPFICRALGWSPAPAEALAALQAQLDQTYHAVTARLPHHPTVRILSVGGKPEPIATALDKLDEPPSLVALREAVKARLPRVELPEILLEIAARTGLAAEFTHISERDARAGDLATSLCAVLLAEACNTGLEPLIDPAVPRCAGPGSCG
jgi:hypothetical protein